MRYGLKPGRFMIAPWLSVFALILMMIAPMAASAATNSIVNRSGGLGDLFTLDMLFNVGNDSKSDLGDMFILDQLFPVEAAVVPVSLSNQLSGRILLQVEKNGEAWYVDPVQGNKRVDMDGPDQSFRVMSSSALGVNNADFDAFGGKAPQRLAGRFLLKTEDAGKLYYVNPVNLGLNFVGSPAGALNLMRTLGLGITDSDLAKIEEVK